MTEKITLGQAKQWRAENQLLREQVAALRSEVDGLHARLGVMQSAREPEDGTFSLIAALALWFFAGAVGAHRFYIRDWVTGFFLLGSALLLPFAWFFTIMAGADSLAMGPIWFLWFGFHCLCVLVDGICLFFDKRARR